jgi:penicillin-binding protein 2
MNSFDIFGNPQEEARVTDVAPGEISWNAQLDGIGEEIADESTPKRPFFGLIGTGILVIALLAVQCYKLQVSNAASYVAQAAKNTVRQVNLAPDRGLIVDDKGAVLAQNSQTLALAINPLTLPAKKTDRQSVYAMLKSKAGLSDDDIKMIEDKRTKTSEIFPVKTDFSKEQGLLYTEWFAETPGVVMQESPARLYASVPSLGQLLGYTGTATQADISAGKGGNEQVGKSGLEAFYDTALAGKAGTQQAEVNAQGQIVRRIVGNGDQAPVTGSTLKLSLDTNLQNIVATALKNEIARRTAKFGASPNLGASAVVLNPSNGEVLAMVSLPDYDANAFSGGISATEYKTLLSDPGNPLLNRTIQGQYPPGSTVKPFVGAAGLQNGNISANTSWTTPCAFQVSGSNFPDWTCHHSTYASNVGQAIADSNDVFFYALAGGYSGAPFTGLGIETMNAYLSKFGLGSKTGIDLPSEAGGLLASNTWKLQNHGEKWFIGDTYHSGIGQGYTLTTPLQMAVGTAAIANGGTTYSPHLADSYIAADGSSTKLPVQILNQGFLSASTIKTIQDGMRQTVVSGSGRPLSTLSVTSAGKTGTAQFGPNNSQTHAWYTGYAPAENPQIAYAIMIEGGGESFYSSVPVAEEILRGYFNEPLLPGQKLSANTEVPADFTGEH